MELKKNEFMLIVDSTNGLALWDEESDTVKKHGLTVKEQVFLNVRDSISIEKLNEKWEVDSKILLGKLETASEEEYKQLWKRIEGYWGKRDKESSEDNE